MAAKHGGYDYEFVDEVPEALFCEIVCGKPLRNPHLTKCCGQHVCESCLDNWFKSDQEKSCPHCREEGEDFQHFLDKSLNRKIRGLQIRCTNRSEGCMWVGELGALDEHHQSDSGCEYVEVECPNKCEHSVFSVMTVKRKDLNDHLRNQCYLRQFMCTHCSLQRTYLDITGQGGSYQKPSHYSVCPEFPLECPNNCGEKEIKRKEIKDHRNECPEELVDCPNKCPGKFSFKQLRRKNMDEHLPKCERRPCEFCGWKPKLVDHRSF